MILRQWDDLPAKMRNDSVRLYYEILQGKQMELIAKRLFDIAASILLLIILSPIFVVLSVAIKLDSKGPIMFRQTRVTQYGRQFKIFKFRTMIDNADRMGAQVTSKNDARVTKVGKLLRKLRLDEIPQLLNVISGDMSFVGTRPEVVEYVERYTEEMMATLLLPAGITSEASIQYKDEELLLRDAINADEQYVNEILPEKMEYNLESIRDYSILRELRTMFNTVVIIARKK